LAGAARATSKPVMTFTTVAGGSPDPQVLEVLDEAGIPLLRGIENALWALRSAIEYADRRARPLAADGEMVRVADPAAAAAARERLTRDGTLSEAWSKRLIAAYGVPVPDGGVATTVVDALRIAAEIGYPVVAKATSPDLTHKTDLGLVRLSITDAGGLRAAFTDVQERADAHVRAAGLRPLEGILIERMTPAGVEVVVGARRSEFGPIAVFGAGGVLTELVADTSVRLAPLGRDEAAAMVSETRIGRLLHGYRGGPTYDVDALARLLRQVAALLGDFEDVVDAVDVNPVLMTPGGPVAVDAVVFGRARGAPPL
jgi:acyl-CoA synthetase (NDP forming)